MANLTEPISDAARNAQESFQHYYADSEEYVRHNPTKAALIAIGTGFLLAQLPLRWMAVALIKVLFLLVKPATFIYAIARLTDDLRGGTASSSGGGAGNPTGH